jgi:hypothetical protein
VDVLITLTSWAVGLHYNVQYCRVLCLQGKEIYMRTCASLIQPTMQPTALVQTLQSTLAKPTQLAAFAETLMCRVVPEAGAKGEVGVVNSRPKASSISGSIDRSHMPQRGCSVRCCHSKCLTGPSAAPPHTHTCKKQGFAGNNWSCRVSMPRPVVANTSVFKDTSTLLVKCNNGHRLFLI